MHSPAQPFSDVLEEHWDDLDFLITQRDQIVFDKDYSLDALAEFEERIEAHLDGVRIAGEPGLIQAQEVLDDGSDDGAVQAATRLLAENKTSDSKLMEALREGPSLAVARGLRHAPECLERLRSSLFECASDSGEPAAQVAARDVLSFHRVAAPMADASLWTHEDPDLRTATWQSAARLGALSPGHLETAQAEGDPTVREAAFRALAHGSVPGLIEALRSAAFRGQGGMSQDPVALRMLGALGSQDDLDALILAAAPRPATGSHPAEGSAEGSTEEPTEESTALRVAALEALGALGSPRALASLAEAIEDEELRDAGLDGWTRITGLELDPETASRAQLERAEDAWLKDKEPGSLWQGGREIPSGTWTGVPDLSLRSRRDLYLALRCTGAAGDHEIEALARRQER